MVALIETWCWYVTAPCVLVCVCIQYSRPTLSLSQERPEAMLLSTLYLTTFLHHVSSIPLMKEFLAFILKGQYDGRAVLEQLILNISSTNTAVSPSVEFWLFFVLEG